MVEEEQDRLEVSGWFTVQKCEQKGDRCLGSEHTGLGRRWEGWIEKSLKLASILKAMGSYRGLLKSSSET